MKTLIFTNGFIQETTLSIDHLKAILRWHDQDDDIENMIFNLVKVHNNYNGTIDVLLVLSDPDITKTKAKFTINSGSIDLFDDNSYWWHDDEWK